MTDKKTPYIALFLLFALMLALIIFKSEQTPPSPTIDKSEPLVEPEELSLQKTSFSNLANWNQDDMEQARSAFIDSCKQIQKVKKEFISNSYIKISSNKYQNICDSLSVSKETFRLFIEKNFDPFLVVYKGSEKGKFTSYYEASIAASRTKSDIYKYPIYGRPSDLIEFNPSDFDPSATNKRFVGRVNGQKLVPYYTRKDIETGKFNAPVILWGNSDVDIFVMQIQGSAVADLDDGSSVRVGYADNNGRPFKGIGSILLEKGLLQPGQASMGKIKLWLKNNSSLAAESMFANERYVFHRLVDADGPIGAQSVPLRAGRSLAVDNSFVPLGSLLWLETTGPDKEKIEKLVVAQDVGGAIKGGVRGDYFWGSGKDDVLDLAGRMNSEGRYFIMIPKD